ncbi:hypothetical protein HLI_21395 (plasmid) [Halobacillus litoralis]|uniref:Uncharacterized protein n=1 Tax=Halobacillus litoralis TaxID=45668 RepID=A0A410MJD2_9BACI|nr:hypothetical protein HLI_21395 [Halobacillus litoralis]
MIIHNRMHYELKTKDLLVIYGFLFGASLVFKELFALDLDKLKLFNQGFVSSFFGLWVVFLYKEFYNDNYKELLYSYPLKTLDLGVKKVVALVLVSWVLLFPLTLFDDNIYNSVLLYFPQSFFLIGLGFLCISVIKNFEVSLTLLLLYISTEFFTKGKFINWVHIFVFEDNLYNQTQYLLDKGVNTLGFSLLLIYVAHIFLIVDRKK